MASEYDVVAYRDGKWWTFEIEALTAPSPRGQGHRIVAMGQARTAAQVPAEARSLASLWTEDDDVSVHVTYRLPKAVRQMIEQAAIRDAEGRAALAEAAAMRRNAARALTAEGLTQADAAAVLGVSRQRVQQLVA
jgi:hypothetical protein